MHRVALPCDIAWVAGCALFHGTDRLLADAEIWRGSHETPLTSWCSHDCRVRSAIGVRRRWARKPTRRGSSDGPRTSREMPSSVAGVRSLSQPPAPFRSSTGTTGPPTNAPKRWVKSSSSDGLDITGGLRLCPLPRIGRNASINGRKSTLRRRPQRGAIRVSPWRLFLDTTIVRRKHAASAQNRAGSEKFPALPKRRSAAARLASAASRIALPLRRYERARAPRCPQLRPSLARGGQDDE